MEEASLFDILTERYRLEETGCRLARISIVAELNEAFPGQRELYHDFMALFKNQDIAESTTGLVLVYPNYFHIVIELPEPSSTALMEWIEKQETSGWISSATVMCSELIQDRSFPPFAIQSVHLSTTKAGEYQASGPISTIVADVIVNSIRLARILTPLSPSQQQSTLDNIQFSHPELLTPQGVFAHIIRSESLDRVAEYLSRNATMFQIKPDNELVWPMPVRLFPYD
ncbi:hypothetical protein PTSG_03759 [Salpingoeca rosetta]|uniref:BLUF domain-containing protein n=1 Tax=Salpingoeca rosetta (strain ATCC 50818 / BSB-021) TaxID=946362 RepID=F2U6I1_SALR5|nr:uncharacterized protein PTSG_03759 [Salpingoeca rosetta]EGD83122.1 hypothetical protein PTSG_03759 [Salpingoeca rosetta]|eukprot:XP_004995486.1 hypothetical protein PTSG_03759 [Salpingoeca rosetta]